MDLRCKLQTIFVENFKIIRERTKKIDDFLRLLEQIETILNEVESNEGLSYSPTLIKIEFTTNFYSNVLHEILFNFNHPDLFIQNEKLNEFKRLLANIIEQTNYEDSFRILFKLTSNLE